MKNIYLLLLLMLTGTQLSSQTYTGNLTLTTQAEVDAFNYDKITGSLTIRGLDIVNLDSLYKLDSILYWLTIDSTNISNLYGLRNARTVYNRGTLTISDNPQIKNVSDLNGFIRSLINDIYGYKRFERVVIKNNPLLTSLDILFNTENIVTINSLIIDNNDKLDQINLYNTSRFPSINIQNNDAVTKILLPNTQVLGYLVIDNNLLLDSILYVDAIPFTYPQIHIKNNESLRYIKDYVHTQDSIRNLTIENNSNLSDLDFLKKFSDEENSSISTIRIVDNKNLSDCCGIQSLLSRNAFTSMNISGNPFSCNDFSQIISQCAIVPRNTVLGRVYIDANNNNEADETDIFLDNIKIQATKNAYSVIHVTNSSGTYHFVNDTGAYDIQPIYSFKNFQTDPAVHTVTYTTYGNTDTMDFKVASDVLVNDASVFLGSFTLARPDRTSLYYISYTNESWKIFNGTISLVLDKNLTYQSALPVPTSVTGNTLTWDITNLPMFTKKRILVNVSTSSSLAANDILISEVKIGNNEPDVTPENNLYIFKDVVRAAYDPNNKIVDKTILSPAAAAESPYLYYTIRFQNIGNDTAFNVYIYDTLDNNLDWNSIELIASSHEYAFEQINGQLVRFDFTNILLPDSNVSEEASHGFITYKIRPKNNLMIGNTIENRASIVFDVNAPVITHTAVTAIMETDAGDDRTICPGESVNLTASGASLYSWGNGVNGISITVSPDTTTTYYVTGEVGGIMQKDSVIVYVYPVQITHLSETISAGQSYNFNGNILTELGLYRDTLQQANGCDSIIVLNLAVLTSVKNNIDFINSVKLYPNPSDSYITIDLAAKKQATFRISLLSLDGKILMAKDYNKTAIINDNIDISHLAAGIYYLKIESENKQAVYSILRQ